MIRLIRWILALTIVFVTLSVLAGTTVKARAQVSLSLPSTLLGKGQVVSLPAPASSHYLFEVDGAPVASQAPDTPWPLASTTKIMTALIVLESGHYTLTQTITVTPQDAQSASQGTLSNDSEIPIRPGQVFTVGELLYGLMLPSGNDAADMLAAAYPGGTPAFVAAMNKKAREMGLASFHFKDPSGLDPGDVGSPRDLIRLSTYAMGNKTFARVVGTYAYNLPGIGIIRNLNTLLADYPAAVGVKTGWTPIAGRDFVYAARLSLPGHPLLFGAILDGPTTFQPVFLQCRELTDWANQNFNVKTLPAGTQLGVARLSLGVQVPLVTSSPITVAGPKGATVSAVWNPGKGPAGLPGSLTVTSGGYSQTVSLKPPSLPLWYRFYLSL